MILRPLNSPAGHARRPPFKLFFLEAPIGDVLAPEGLRYRTSPKIYVARGEGSVVVKCDTLETVRAEALGYCLAQLVSLPVPAWGLAKLDVWPHIAFCSVMQERFEPTVHLRRGNIENPQLIADSVVFDIWVGNNDRNVGGYVTRIPETGRAGELELLAIDFELAHLLRGMSVFQLNTDVNLRPRPEVLRLIRRTEEPLREYEDMCRRIALVTEDQIRAAFERIQVRKGDLFDLYPSWADTAVRSLSNRAKNINLLVSETFRAG